MTHSVTEAAIIDLEKGKEAMARRARNFDGEAAGGRARGRDTILTPEHVDALCEPVRLTVSFSDPLHTRAQLETLSAAIVEAMVVTQDHGRGINRQRMDLRHIMKSAAEALVYMNGKTPTGRKKLAPKTF